MWDIVVAVFKLVRDFSASEKFYHKILGNTEFHLKRLLNVWVEDNYSGTMERAHIYEVDLLHRLAKYEVQY